MVFQRVLVTLYMRLKDIHMAIAKECIAMGDDSKNYITRAFSAYCVALKKDGKSVPLWSEAGALKGVHREIKNLKGVKHL